LLLWLILKGRIFYNAPFFFVSGRPGQVLKRLAKKKPTRSDENSLRLLSRSLSGLKKLSRHKHGVGLGQFSAF